MRLNGRRQSSNIDDRRASGGGRRGLLTGGGIAGVIIAAVIAWLGGGDFFNAPAGDALHSGQFITDSSSTSTPTQEAEELATFSKQILAGTEDVWSEIFRQNGLEYEAPTLVLYSGSTTSGCGQAQSSTGPFYCSADQSVYIDLSFFKEMKSTLGADAAFAYGYVIADEVGHHVQYLLGTLDHAH